MASDSDETKDLLEKLVADLYGAATKDENSKSIGSNESYLEAHDGQYLGKITKNDFDRDSIRNEYGPYGSKYSKTSIFNPYCPYGGAFGRFSPENPYSSTPPRLVINGQEIGKISANNFIPHRIPFEAFIYSLRNEIDALLRGSVTRDLISFHEKVGDIHIRSADGVFLGSLNPNRLDVNSIFNRYGKYGNRYSELSIFNRYSNYGSRYSAYSPYHPTTRTPPEIISGGRRIAYLTVNTSMAPRVDPDQIFEWAKSNVRRKIG